MKSIDTIAANQSENGPRALMRLEAKRQSREQLEHALDWQGIDDGRLASTPTPEDK